MTEGSPDADTKLAHAIVDLMGILALAASFLVNSPRLPDVLFGIFIGAMIGTNVHRLVRWNSRRRGKAGE